MLFYPKQKASELMGVVFLACSLLLLLSLLSYSGLDPSASVSSSSPQYANYVGKLGALSSDFLFQILGLAALYLPVLLMVVGYKTLRNRPLGYPFIKLFAFCCTLATISAGLTLLSPTLPETVNFTVGGILGILFAHLLLLFLNTPGSLVVVATLLILSLMMTTRLSIDQTLSWIQSLNWKALWAMRSHYADWRKRRQDRKKLAQLSQDKRRLVVQSPPKKMFLDQPPAAAAKERERPAVKVMLPPHPSIACGSSRGTSG